MLTSAVWVIREVVSSKSDELGYIASLGAEDLESLSGRDWISQVKKFKGTQALGCS